MPCALISWMMSKIPRTTIGREAERRLVHHDKLRLCHQRASNGQHLLFAAGECAGHLPLALFQAGGTGRRRGRDRRGCPPCGRYAPMRRFSSTVRFGNTRRPSGTSGRRARRSGRSICRAASRPWKVMEPDFGLTRPAMVLSVVDLPAPFEPMSVTILPCFDGQVDALDGLDAAVGRRRGS